MFLSPKTSRSNINSLFNAKSININTSKEDIDNKLAEKRLLSRNNDNNKNQKNFLYKKIVPSNLIQFSSNNSTSSNTSYLNNIKANNQIYNDYDTGFKNLNQNYIKRNMKYFKRQDYSNILINNTKDKMDNIFQKYNKKNYNNSNIKNENINNNIQTKHNRSLSKNLNKDLVISKMVDKLAIDNINKINKFNINLNQNKNKLDKFDLEKTFLGSMTTKEYNSHFITNSKNKISFPISTTYKNIISINNINSLGTSRHSELTSSTGNIYTKKTSKQISSSKLNFSNC